MKIVGRAWKFSDGISTDHIAPGRFFHLRSNLPELARHVLEDARPEFARQVKPGDFVVAGRNFGQAGLSRQNLLSKRVSHYSLLVTIQPTLPQVAIDSICGLTSGRDVLLHLKTPKPAGG